MKNIITILLLSASTSIFGQLLTEDFQNGLPNSWSSTFTSDTSWFFNNPANRTIIQGNGFSGNFAMVDSDQRGSGRTQHSFLRTPSFSTLNSNIIELKFAESYRTCCGSTGAVKVSIDNGLNWDTVLIRNFYNRGYPNPLYNLIDISHIAANQANVIVEWDYQGSFDYWWAIDSVRIEGQNVSCRIPTNPNSQNTTSNSATLNWTELNGATSWEIEYGNKGFALGSGTKITINSKPYNLSALLPNTDYDWYIRSICSNMDSSQWSVKNQFLTECEIVSNFPYLEDFELTQTLNCWTSFAISGNTDWQTNTGNAGGNVTTAHSGNTNLILFSTNAGDQTALISPTYNLSSLNNPYLTFYHSQEDIAQQYQDSLKVLYRASSSSPLIQLASYRNSINSWTKQSIQLPNPSPTYQLFFEGTANVGRGVTIDDISIFDSVSCVAPTNLQSSAITSNSVQLAWTENGTATAWEIEWDTSGFVIGSGNRFITTTNPHSFSGLIAGTSYDWYVRSICGQGDTSLRSVVNTFVTAATPIIPYYPIATINTENTIGIADSLNVSCWTSGIVIGADVDGNVGLSFTIIDMSSGIQEGINVHNFNDISNYVVTEGDSILLRGFVKQFGGLTQLEPDSIQVLSSGLNPPSPIRIDSLGEQTESRLIRMDSLVVTQATGVGIGSYNFTFSKNGTSMTARIDSDTEIHDSLMISGLSIGDTICSLVGIGGQYDTNSPFSSGYQIQPYQMKDMDTVSCQLVNIVDTKRSAKFSLYPNPSNGIFKIITTGLENSNANIVIRDINGRIVYDKSILTVETKFENTIDISNNLKGLYFINITTNSISFNKRILLK